MDVSDILQLLQMVQQHLDLQWDVYSYLDWPQKPKGMYTNLTLKDLEMWKSYYKYYVKSIISRYKKK